MLDNKDEVIEQENENKPDNALEVIQAQLAEQKEYYLRIVADYADRMRRAEQDAQHIINLALEKVAKEMLPLLHDISQAMQLCTGATKDGLEMIYKNFKTALSKQGIEEINAKLGDDFDPNLHEAVDQQEQENVEPGKIIKTIQPGYKLKQKVITAAAVVISK